MKNIDIIYRNTVFHIKTVFSLFSFYTFKEIINYCFCIIKIIYLMRISILHHYSFYYYYFLEFCVNNEIQGGFGLQAEGDYGANLVTVFSDHLIQIN